MRRRAIGRAGVIATALLAGGLSAAPSAGAAATLGETFANPTQGCNTTPHVLLQSTSPGSAYAAPSDGVITQWSTLPATVPPQMKLKLARAAGGNSFTIVGESAFETPAASTLSTFDTRIPVQAGDIIGFTRFGMGVDCQNVGSAVGFVAHSIASADPSLGTTATYAPLNSVKLDLSAVLEPDCDSDGFGDETQDPDTSSCNPSVAPDTTITKGPKAKTKKKTASFEFVSSVPGSTFQCKLETEPGFKDCLSPTSIKVSKGKHTFRVRAMSPGGTFDATPASQTWKVKRKK